MRLHEHERVTLEVIDASGSVGIGEAGLFGRVGEIDSSIARDAIGAALKKLCKLNLVRRATVNDRPQYYVKEAGHKLVS
jgi:L-alanine-DL-glutamate epimerase-like enolase superfamily enzyme